MKVAAIQFAPVFKDKRGNLQKLRRLVAQAAVGGAKLIVLPELCTTGYSFMSEEEAREFAECPRWMDDEMNPEHGMHAFYTLASKLNVSIVWGFVELDPGTKKLYNSQLYIGPDGFYESYRKINRWGNDFLWATAGNANPPVIRATIDGVERKIGLLICRDVRDKVNDDWKNLYSPGDADIVAFSSNWGDGGFPAVNWMDFAAENHAVLIVANRYGQETCNNFGEGGSCIIEPNGKVHCQGLKWDQDCIIYADIP